MVYGTTLIANVCQMLLSPHEKLKKHLKRTSDISKILILFWANLNSISNGGEDQKIIILHTKS